MPGIGDEIDGAVQQAPQPGRQAGAEWEVTGRKEVRTAGANAPVYYCQIQCVTGAFLTPLISESIFLTQL
jgi:hypothetical protein